MDNIKIREKGSYADYFPETVHKDVIYFSEDTRQILLNGEDYGGKPVIQLDFVNENNKNPFFSDLIDKYLENPDDVDLEVLNNKYIFIDSRTLIQFRLEEFSTSETNNITLIAQSIHWKVEDKIPACGTFRYIRSDQEDQIVITYDKYLDKTSNITEQERRDSVRRVGTLSDYQSLSSSEKDNLIYFATDTGEILVNDQSYTSGYILEGHLEDWSTSLMPKPNMSYQDCALDVESVQKAINLSKAGHLVFCELSYYMDMAGEDIARGHTVFTPSMFEEITFAVYNIELSGNLFITFKIENDKVKYKTQYIEDLISSDKILNIRKDYNGTSVSLNINSKDIQSDSDQHAISLVKENNKLDVKYSVDRPDLGTYDKLDQLVNSLKLVEANTIYEITRLLKAKIDGNEQAFKSFLEDTDASNTAINKWKEIEQFLTEITDTDTLTGLLQQLESKWSTEINAIKSTSLSHIRDNQPVTTTTDKVSISYTCYSGDMYKSGQGTEHSLDIPTATTTSAGVMSAADKTTLNQLKNVNHIPAGGNAQQVLAYDANGRAKWGSFLPNTNYSRQKIDGNNMINITPHSDFGTRFGYKTDNNGYKTLLLIAEVPGNAEHNTIGFSGTIYWDRAYGCGSNNKKIDVVAESSYIGLDTLKLKSSQGKFITPCVVEYNHKAYIALVLSSSASDFVMHGWFRGCLDQFIQLNSSSYDETYPPIDGIQYLAYMTKEGYEFEGSDSTKLGGKLASDYLLKSDADYIFAYGVQWDTSVADPHLTRIGNMTLHKTLPIQSQLKGCIAQGDRIMYWLDENDWRKIKGSSFDIEGQIAERPDLSIQNRLFFRTGENFQKEHEDDWYLERNIALRHEVNGQNHDFFSKIVKVCEENGRILFELDFTIDDNLTEPGKTTYACIGSRLDGYDGTVRVYCPKFYIKSQIIGNIRRVWLSTMKIDYTWTCQPEILIDAYKSTVLNTVQENMGYLSTLPVNSAISVVNTAAYCRGGGNRADRDTYLETDPFRTDLGKPRTNQSRSTFRTECRNAGNEMLSYDQYKNIFYWLYVVEYANFNCQEAYNADLTDDGYRQGGMGSGVTTWSDAQWSVYNNYYPVTPCGYGNDLGNRTGIKKINIPETTSGSTVVAAKTFDMPRWRGFDNPFGDIWTNLDGIIIDADADNHPNNMNYIYTCQDPDKFGETLTEDWEKIGEEIHQDGYTKLFDLGDAAHIIPKVMGGNPTTYKCDYHWIGSKNTALRALLVGGHAHNGAHAGLGGFYSYLGVSSSWLHVGFRSVSRFLSFSSQE